MTQYIFVNRFYYPDISATSQMLSDLATSLAAASLDVTVLCSQSRYDDPTARLPAFEIVNNVKIIRVSTTSFGRGRVWRRIIDYTSFYCTMLWTIVKIVKKGDWIIAKTDPPLMSIPLLVISSIKSARLANWLQDIFPEIAEAAGFKIKFRPLHGIVMSCLYSMRNWSLRHSDFNVVLSSEMLARVNKLGVPKSKLAVVPNWSDTVKITPISHIQNPLRSQWNLSNRFVVGYSGNMGIAHDLDTIVEAASLLKDSPDIMFLMIGSGFRKNFMVVEVEKKGLKNKVIFKAYQPRDKLAWSLGCVDLHLVSLRPEMEGLIVPSKFYGVCAAGRPMIYLGSKNSTIGRELCTYECGTVASDGAAELVRIIKYYAENPDICKDQGQRARENIALKNTVTRASKQWQKLFESGA